MGVRCIAGGGTALLGPFFAVAMKFEADHRQAGATGG